MNTHTQSKRNNLFRDAVRSCLSIQSIPLMAITWNVNARIDRLASVRDDLFYPHYTEGVSELYVHPKLVVIGLQEMVELSTTSVIGSTVLGQQCQERLAHWAQLFLACLHEENSYFELVSSQYMVGLALLVYATSDVKVMMRNMQVSQLARGVGGVLGNKGALYCRFELCDSSVCVVNAHFAAHREAVKKRNADFQAIMRHKAFPDCVASKVHSLQQEFLAQQPQQQRSAAVASGGEHTTSSHISLRPLSMLPGFGLDAHLASQSDASLRLQQVKRSIAKLRKNVDEIVLTMPAHYTAYETAQPRTQTTAATATMYSSSSPVPSRPVSMSTKKTQLNGSHSPLPSFHGAVPTDAVSAGQSVTHTAPKRRNNKLLSSSSSATGAALSPEDHDVVLWLGDLNYRIDSSLTTSNVYELIYADMILPLSELDQLNQEREKNLVFQRFNEGLLTFPPTYQYIPGTDEYDERKEKKQRCPAWCDRILWRIGKSSVEEKIALAQLQQREKEERAEADEEKGESERGEMASEKMSEKASASAKRKSHSLKKDKDRPHVDRVYDSDDDSDSDSERATSDENNSSQEHVLQKHSSLNLQDIIQDILHKQNGKRLRSEEFKTQMTRVDEDEDYDEAPCAEAIELMSYHHCKNKISDHKPVKAMMNLKVKSVDWMRVERDLIRNYTPMLTNMEEEKYLLREQALRLRRVHVTPMVCSLRSQCAKGDSGVITLRNLSTKNDCCMEIDESSLPAWLRVEIKDPIVSPLSTCKLLIRNNHEQTTLALVDLVEAFRDFDSETLPRLAKVLDLPQNDPKMQVSAVLVLSVRWLGPGKDISAKDSSERAVVGSEQVVIPVICALAG